MKERTGGAVNVQVFPNSQLGNEKDITEQIKYEVGLQSRLLKTADFMEAAAAFIEKREPIFKGR